MNREADPLRSTSAAIAACVLLTVGCASGQSQDPPAPDPVPVPPQEEPAAERPSDPDAEEDEGPGLWELCRHDPPEDEDAVDQSRRVLQETFCGATLWFDGLFGGQPDVAGARRTSGRVELSTLYSEFEGLDLDGRLRLRYELPNLERRVNLFLGRGDPDEIVQDREEGLALRSAASGLEDARAWLAGLGLRVPGRWLEAVEFRGGVEVSSSPELFVQGRLGQRVAWGRRSALRFRETVFWRSRQGPGVTVSVDYDRVLSPLLVLRWSSIGTLSEASEGVVWRGATVLYRSLDSGRAVAAEPFARGATSAEVPVGEYGIRGIYRQPLRPYLFGQLVVGYSWPRDDPHLPRNGSPMVGLGAELLFGVRPPP